MSDEREQKWFVCGPPWVEEEFTLVCVGDEDPHKASFVFDMRLSIGYWSETIRRKCPTNAPRLGAPSSRSMPKR